MSLFKLSGYRLWSYDLLWYRKCLLLLLLLLFNIGKHNLEGVKNWDENLEQHPVRAVSVIIIIIIIR